MGEAQVQSQTSVVPSFWVENLEPLRDFYLQKLGFGHMMGVVGKDGKLDFAIVTLDGVMVMMGRPLQATESARQKADGSRPVDVYVYVKDVDAYHEQVKGKLKLDTPLQTQWWGDRNFSLKDPYGYTLWFCQTVAELQPPPGVTVI